MPLDVALQMDPISRINVAGDSSFMLGLEAQRRGHRLFYYEPPQLACRDGRVSAPLAPLTLRRDPADWFTLGEARRRPLEEMDVVLMRQDPPFDMAYITYTHFLALLPPRVVVVNEPVSVRNAPEKLLVTLFPDLTPATLITRDIAEIRAFRAEHEDIILKALFGNGGLNVYRLKPDDENLGALLETLLAASRDPVIVQAYLPAVRQGDKRILLVEGEPVGAVNRVPAAGEARANMHVGGRPEKCALTERDREICARIGPLLRERGLLFVGIDVIGGWLTEINVTSPTGIQEINRLDGVEIEKLTWDAIEARVAAAQG